MLSGTLPCGARTFLELTLAIVFRTRFDSVSCFCQVVNFPKMKIYLPAQDQRRCSGERHPSIGNFDLRVVIMSVDYHDSLRRGTLRLVVFDVGGQI